MTTASTPSQIRQAIAGDIAELKRRVVAAENQLARQVIADCRAATPVDTGEMLAGWGIAVELYRRDLPGGGDEALDRRLFGQQIYVYNNDFRAYFFEHGTEKMPPRPMAAPAVERANATTVRP